MATKPSKRMIEARKLVDLEKIYSPEEAVKNLSTFPKAKFDETVELYARLAVDPKQSNQMVRGMVALPNGSGKKVTVLVFTEKVEEALSYGANYAGLNDLIEKINGGWMEFDVAIATSSAMKEVRKVARVLGPRGLMPNPKSGTVTDDVAAAIREVKAGRVEYKMDKTANLAVVVGKRSFTNQALLENVQSALESLAKARPEALKGALFIKSLTLSSTMSPGVRLDTRQVNLGGSSD